jgi:hypothetical protein
VLCAGGYGAAQQCNKVTAASNLLKRTFFVNDAYRTRIDFPKQLFRYALGDLHEICSCINWRMFIIMIVGAT